MENFEVRYKKLNAEQKLAVDTIEGPVLVIAGPGSGKTEILALRVAKILQETQVSASNILLLTFTENGAKNMRERIIKLIGEDGYRVSIYTFHSFASQVMSRYAEYFFNGAAFRPATEIEKINILENLLKALPKDNPLSSFHPELGFTYLSDIQEIISALKKGNLTGEEFKEKIKKSESEYAEINQTVGEYFLNIKNIRKLEIVKEAYLNIYEALAKLASEENSSARFLVDILGLEIKQTEETSKATNLTQFKNKYFTQDENENYILKLSEKSRIEKWLSLSDIYEKYNVAMYEAGLYDFDDMIFKVGRELAKNINLRNELEEKYQYIMLDEFQDTSDAQFALIQALTKSEINEGKANVLAVGDDDQAIFKFQGAELDNVTKFIKAYTDVKLITLTQNYRSTQNILDEARNIIVKVEDRLENRFPEINKRITASNQDLIQEFKLGKIIEKQFENLESEYLYVAEEIQKILKNKVKANEISVISRSHKNLKKITKIFNQFQIPYTYEKENNVFEKEPIREILTIVEFVESGLNQNLKEELLPNILTFKFWGLPRLAVWELAEKIRNGKTSKGELGETVYERKSWLQAMLASQDLKIKRIAEFLIDLITEAKTLPLLHLIDKIIGSNEYQVELDEEVEEKIENKKSLTEFISPFRNYYFGKRNFEDHKMEYLDFLLALQTFMGALREYKNGEILFAKDLPEFLEIYQNNKLTLATTSLITTNEEAVVMQTAHKSKGLEYEYVFIINSDEGEWAKGGKSNKIGLPVDLPLLNDKDDLNDRVRLYYVAMTRAKHTLYITHNQEKFSLLLKAENETEKSGKEIKTKVDENLLKALDLQEKLPLVQDEKSLLKNILADYKIPVTHLTNFLNFAKVGPEKFIEQNLLRFPQAISPSGIYGTAMHEALQLYYLYKKANQKNPDLDRVIQFFTKALQRGELSKVEYEKYHKAGIKNLEIVIQEIEEKEELGEIAVEVDFKNEGVRINGVSATGKIDKLVIIGKSLSITDFKTGKSFASWEDGKSNYDKIKLHFFKYQLAFYVLLIRNSKNYQKYTVEDLYIHFLETNKNTTDKISILSGRELEDLVKRVADLTKIVAEKILNLDFPDTNKYIESRDSFTEKEITLKNILAFEEDLLSGKI